MSTYLEVAVNVPQVAGVFHYHLPAELEGKIQAGHLVEVPFGNQQVQGIVLRFVERPSVAETRPVSGLVDAEVVLTPVQLQLAEHLSHSTLSPLAACIGLMLPPGLGQQADTIYALAAKIASPGKSALSETQKRLLKILEQRGPLRGRQIDRALPRHNWRPAARSLTRRGLLTAQPVLLPPGVRPKTVRTVRLATNPEAVQASLPSVGKAGTPALERRQAILRYLLAEPGPVDASWVYAESGGNLPDLHKLEALGLVQLGESEVWRDALGGMDFQPVEPPALTRDQAGCWQQIQEGLAAARQGKATPPYLLHGVTGSGKTEIYLQAVNATLQQGRQAIILVPEIALTPQTVRRFMARFPGKVGLIHSGLSTGERYDTWRRARLGELSLVVGPRSALFTPFANLGLIVVDECHDDTYYQNEPPFYNAREAAVAYAQLARAVCLLGSATPDLTSAHLAAQGKWRYLKLPARILAHRQAVHAQAEKLKLEPRFRPYEQQAETIELPPVEVIDMRQELKAGNRSIFSRPLQAALGEVLALDQQAILFLNRRGTATYVFCRDCGNALKCPRCDIPLTYHSPAQALTCHHCGYRRNLPQKCPQCQSARIRQYGTGTERVEAEVQAMFPSARTLRWDYESTRQKGAHEAILNHFISQRANVLIGTQMLAKGLDLPLVTLVGVVLADVGLNMPDFRAAERTFQVLTQVAGRAGRSPLGGKVILQTFQPEHYAIQAAAGHSYRDFYQKELEYRRQLGYPPFAQLVRLEHRQRDPLLAEQAANKLAEQIRGWMEAEGYRSTTLTGPVPCFFARVAGFYRWQILLRGPDPAALLRLRPLSDWRIEVNPPSLL